MTRDLDRYPVPARSARRRISPTVVSQFVRLDQCRRFLRLSLHERGAGSGFMRAYDVAPQEILPLLTRAGAEFEARVEECASSMFPTRNLALGRSETGREHDNDDVIAAARDLAAGEAAVLFQPRLRVPIDGWDMTGDADIVRLERADVGDLLVLIADMKATTTAKVEHRLQVAFYREMVERLLATSGVEFRKVSTGILYRGAPDLDEPGDPVDAARIEAERDAAACLFRVDGARFELTPDPDAYRDAVCGLVTGPESVANQVCDTPFVEIPWHLTYKCDGCLYNEFCMKWAAEHDDLSLLPHLGEHEKTGLRRAGVVTTRDLAAVLQPAPDPESARPDLLALEPSPEWEAVARRVARTWPVGPRLEELVHRARRYRSWQGDAIDSLSFIPSKGSGSLPYSDADHNPNLVRVFIDAQHDYLHDRLYLIGSLVVGNAGGRPDSGRRRTIVHLTDGPPDAVREQELLLQWVDDTIRAIAEIAAPDENGEPHAPIHLIFYNGFEQKLLLQALSRHGRDILAATPLYDFITQIAAFDSPVATFLDQEIRELKNYPIVCQSLQAVASTARPSGAWFDWNAGVKYREIFRERLFDSLGRFEHQLGDGNAQRPWSTRRARFNSQIPLEYAYAAWGTLPDPPPQGRDPYEPYRRASARLLISFQGRRLEALEHIANDFVGNRDTTKTTFTIPDLSKFNGKAHGLAEALQEFVTIERHVELAAWKAARLPAPERRVLSGDTLLVRYLDEDQLPGVAETLRENARRAALYEVQREQFKVANPDATCFRLPKAERELSKALPLTDQIRLRIDVNGCGVSLDDALALSTLKDGNRFVLAPRWMQDERLAVADRVDLTPTPKALLYRMRADLEEIEVIRDDDGRAVAAWLAGRAVPPMQSGNPAGYLFSSHDEQLVDGKEYTVDTDPNDIYGFWGAKVVQGLLAGARNTLFERVRDGGAGTVAWSPEARDGQSRFMAGLRAMHQAGAGKGFETSKIEFIGDRGAVPLLLVQGPPGTGKSFTTAYAVLARMQGAMTAGVPFRVLAGTKTHAATDVLMTSILDAQAALVDMQRAEPGIFAEHFDRLLLEIPLYRLQPREPVPNGVRSVFAKGRRPKEQARALDIFASADYAIVASTPGGVYAASGDDYPNLFAHEIFELLVLDEASQLSLPESIMAALPVKRDGQIVIVGDHRQMAPIVKHDWENETRRTFQDYAVYRSLFDTVRQCRPHMIQFEESFRLDQDMAEFLRVSIYARDDLAFHSKREGRLRFDGHEDEFVRAALDPDHPLVVIVHDEAESQVRNDFERDLTAPLLGALYDAGYRVRDGFGLVVPHRAQRANLQEILRRTLPGVEDADDVARAVDTVERFQGGERDAIIVSATESDPAYLLAAGKFLYDPRRLTVAISRAKDKMILVASRSVFDLFSPDEETFANAQLWKDLLLRTCTVPLWDGV
ncbi:MAG: AAA family ATPase, partial [Chloroflexi bacterium]|nr:AAA family ATPase [Chloroflexota bacterium]